MISEQLKKGKKVGFAIARRQVVLEIKERLEKIFKNIKVVAVCQGYTNDINGDLIVCTTHQLFRYRNYFDVLIIDEPDAFPYKGNEVLHGISKNACKNVMVYLTATPDESLLKNKNLKHLYLSRRAHGYDLCVPSVVCGNYLKLFIKSIRWLNTQLEKEKKVIVFTPTIKLAHTLYYLLKDRYSICQIDSKSNNRDEIIANFKNNKYQVCVATTVLERGVTIPNVNIMVVWADNQVFDTASLIQTSGRVGRNINYPTGECLFLCLRKQRSVDECIEMIKKANSYE